MHISNTVAISYIGWCGLGFIRGMNSYKYNYNKYDKNSSYLYTHAILKGICGFGVYSCPICLPILVYKELYRLETDIRNLENEKNNTWYQDLL